MWQIVDGPSQPYRFEGVLLEPGQHVVVAGNPAAFAARYGDLAAPVVGPYAGNLSNGGELIRVENPDGVLVLEFEYDDAAPWPITPDGDGPSLELRDVQTFTLLLNDGLVWRASAALNGTPGAAASSALPGDLNGDGAITSADIDTFCRADGNNPAFDFTGDGIVNESDLDTLVKDILGTTFGDADLNGVFDTQDLVAIFQVGHYEDDVPGNSTWATGDWNCDGEFTSSDLVKALQNGTIQ